MSEIGVIGQIYEDRRTKKQGKLVERDEKYKTLLLETSDGKSFNVSFGGFKSNWRSVDEHVETVEEAIAEVEENIPEEKTEEPVQEEVVQKPRKKRAESNVSQGLEELTLSMLDYAKSFNNDRIHTDVLPQKRMVTLKVDTVRMFVMNYLRKKDMFQAYSTESFLMLIKNKKYVHNVKYHENWPHFKYVYQIDKDALDTFFEDVRSYVIDYLCK